MNRRMTAAVVVPLALAFVVGCATSERSTKEDENADRTTDSVRLEDELTGDLAAYYEETTIPVDVTATHPGVFKRRINKKARRLKELRERLRDVAGESEAPRKAAALYRIGELFLNFGCELARLKPPNEFGKEKSRKLRALTLEKAATWVRKSTEGFAEARRLEVATRRDEVETFRDVWDDTSNLSKGERAEEICRRTRGLWKKATVRIADEQNQACRDGDTEACVAAARMADEPAKRREFLRRACDGGKSTRCHELGGELLEESPGEALELFRRGCESGAAQSCLAAEFIVVSGERDAYVEACRNGDPMGCLKFGRLVREEGEVRMHERCDAEGGPSPETSEEVAGACLERESYDACMRRAGALFRTTAPDITDSSKIAVVMRQESDDGKAYAELKSECRNDTASACYRAGLRARESDEDPVLMFERGCRLDDASSCYELGVARLDDGQVERAFELLEDNCMSGHSESCHRLGERFASDKNEPTSLSCAAFYDWRVCNASNPTACELEERFPVEQSSE